MDDFGSLFTIGWILLLVFGVFYALVIGNVVKQHQRDKAAKEVLSDFDFASYHNKIDLLMKHLQKQATGTIYCPQCGGIITKRFGKYGVFWGCNMYYSRECKYTQPGDILGVAREDVVNVIRNGLLRG